MSSAPTPNNPPCPAYRCQEKDSFAYPTAVERWPVILTNVIDDVYKSYRDEVDPQKQREAKEIIERIGALKYEMQRDRPFRPIEEDGSTDYTTWNAILSQDFPNSSWFSATWLFSECYLYRRVRESFNLTTTWSGYDPFFRQKTSTFQGSSSAVFDLARRFSVPIPSQSDTERHLWFHELAQVCLWGNATDLSLLVNMTEENIKSLQATGAQRLEEQEKNIIVNDLERVWEKVKEMKGGRVDFVLDNAGFELFVDLVLADYLLQTSAARTIYFHCKTIPWFVSDTLPSDFHWLLDSCTNTFFSNASEPDLASLHALALRWKSYLASGAFVVESDPFWCSGYAYWHLRDQAPQLYEELSGSDLVVFKGDLNFRKLTYDCKWPATTRFREAIGPVMSTLFPPLVSLRTNKADVCVGLREGKEKELVESGEADWRWSGKFAVVEYSEGRLN
ncbi:hypothetical protein BC936DRAFT_136927 [Jimgerdemannia flammicorona]|uniref:Sugar phosphate phosphatase n=1 Tax=Jimgerdemannia flammicorona TaxID=994334 RepID=A0A433CYH7_9FUNG|nr:hypothetical protein BC936DRAFT_136927 [Jimgerdemannia flammicorona]